MARWIEGIVSILLCKSCGRRTPHLTFSGDTDMVTTGLASFSSVAGNEIIVAEAQGAEVTDRTGNALLSRVAGELNRDDLRVVRLLRTEAPQVRGGISFKEFREVFRAPTLIFSCPHCVRGEAQIEREFLPGEFRNEGGKLIVQPDLEVRA